MKFSDVDNRALEILRQHGDAFASIREVEHFAYFPTTEKRASFIEKCLAHGFKLRRTSEPYRHDTRFGVILFHSDIPGEEILGAVRQLLSGLAEEFDGGYDGWETQLV